MADAIAMHLEPFGPVVDSMVVYLKWMELYFAANVIKANKRVPVFLNVIEWENFSLYGVFYHHRNSWSSA